MSDFKKLKEQAKQHIMHYFPGDFEDYLVTKAEGSYVYDENGRKILDFCSGQMCSTIGHNHPEVVKAIETSCKDMIHTYSAALSPPVIELATELANLLPPNLQKVCLLNTGGESIELAVHLAKMVTGRFEVVALRSSWHGQQAGARSLTYIDMAHKGYGPNMPGTMSIPNPYCYHCPIKHCDNLCDTLCLDVGFEMIETQCTSIPAAILVEPIQSGGGVIVPNKAWFKKLREYCDRHGILLIFDEAQTAFRLGKNFAFEVFDVVPDILATSKSLGGGIPLAATMCSDEIDKIAHERGFTFYTSHVSDPLPAYVGLAVLKAMAEEDLVNKAAEKGEYLEKKLLALKEKFEVVGDVRGMGLLQGIEFVKDKQSREPYPELLGRVEKEALKLGVSINVIHGIGASMRLGPPLNVSYEEIDLGMQMLEEAIQRSL